MIRLLYYELLKLIKRKAFWVITLTLLIIDVSLVYTSYKIEDLQTSPTTYINQIYEEIEGFSMEEKLSYFEYEIDLCERIEGYSTALQLPEMFEMPNMTSSEKKRYEKYLEEGFQWNARMSVLKELYSYHQEISNYPKYVQGVSKKLDQLKTSPMWLMMEEKEREDAIEQVKQYEALREVELKPIQYKGIEKFANSIFAKLISLVLLCCVGILILKEDNTTTELTLSTKNGHQKNILAKVCAFVIISIILVVILQFVDVWWNLCLYGSCDFGNVIQTIPSLYKSPFLLTIKEWCIQSIFLFSLCLTLFLVLFLFLYYIFETKMLAFIVFYMFVGIEAILYTIIDQSSFLVSLSQVNIMSLFDGTIFGDFISYQHVLSFRIPLHISIILFCVVVAIVSAGSMLLLYKKRILKKKKEEKTIHISSTSLHAQESSRIMLINKAVVIVIVALSIFVGLFINRYQENENARKIGLYEANVFEKYEGEISSYTVDAITSRMNEFASKEMYCQEAKAQYKEGSITYEELKKIESDYSVNPLDKQVYSNLYTFIEEGQSYIVYNKGFSSYFRFANPDGDLLKAILLMFVVMLFASSTVYHEKEEMLYVTTYKGRKNRGMITWIHFIVVPLLIFVVAELLEYIYIHTINPMNDFHVSMQLLSSLQQREIPSSLATFSAGQYIVLLLLLRLFAFVSVCLVSFGIMRITQNKIVGLILCVLLFLVPIFLYYNGFEFALFVSVFDILMGNLFVYETFSVLKLIMWLIVDAVFIRVILKSYTKKEA